MHTVKGREERSQEGGRGGGCSVGGGGGDVFKKHKAIRENPCGPNGMDSPWRSHYRGFVWVSVGFCRSLYALLWVLGSPHPHTRTPCGGARTRDRETHGCVSYLLCTSLPSLHIYTHNTQPSWRPPRRAHANFIRYMCMCARKCNERRYSWIVVVPIILYPSLRLCILKAPNSPKRENHTKSGGGGGGEKAGGLCVFFSSHPPAFLLSPTHSLIISCARDILSLLPPLSVFLFSSSSSFLQPQALGSISRNSRVPRELTPACVVGLVWSRMSASETSNVLMTGGTNRCV